MIVMTPLSGAGYTAPIPTTNAQFRRRVDAEARQLQRMGGPRIQIAPAGMGVLDTVPKWAWAGGAGLVGGLVIGALVFKKR